MISITPDSVWVHCKDCGKWIKLTAPDATILYSFSETPLLNWIFFECDVCEQDKFLFLLSHEDPAYLLARLQDTAGVAEVALALPSDTDLALFASTYGHEPKLHVRLYIETKVAEFSKELDSFDSPLESLE